MAWMPLQLLAERIGISVKKLRRIFCKFSREVVISNDGDLIKIEDETIYLNEKCVYMLLAWSNELHIDNIADVQSDFHEALEEAHGKDRGGEGMQGEDARRNARNPMIARAMIPKKPI